MGCGWVVGGSHFFKLVNFECVGMCWNILECVESVGMCWVHWNMLECVGSIGICWNGLECVGWLLVVTLFLILLDCEIMIFSKIY